MHGLYNNLVSLCMILEKELARVVDKLETNGSVISPTDMDYVDKISHSIKSVVTTKAMISPLDKESEIHDDTQVSELKMILEELASRIEAM